MANYYCEYCGQQYPSTSALANAICSRHPNGPNKGKHSLYEGSEKSRYTCKYCGQKFLTISDMTTEKCMKHPNGYNKAAHVPSVK